ncbi:MAG TPA: response regulator transcription factor [Nocardioides sp.]|jgi:two-component system, OmpR family, response regulator|uniref:response regulator transcription factor n=1 Tax=Nocardioides sp. TaxID=35761 RepID=UPI002C49A04B|nr:response regulator transcription factor [Nocardioides sp.]HTW15536.1 response regulator transcription factor [Nocardioides sp.]
MDAGSEWTAVIIEDDPDVRDLIDIVLTQSGFKTVVAENGHVGVDAVRAHNPLITTLDVNMPGMDGFAVAKRLREFSSTYLIMITALGDEIDVVQGFEAGADDYLVKPFRPRELRARADSMLRRPRARGGVPTPAAAATPPPPPPAPEPESWAVAAAREIAEGSGGTYSGAGKRRAPEQYDPPAAPAAPAAPPAPPAPPAYQPPPAPPAPAPVPAPAPPVQQQPSAPQQPVASDGWLRYHGLAVNAETRIATLNGAAIELSRPEFDLLASLMETGRRVRSKADLVLTMRGQQYVTSYFVNEADKRSVEVHVANIRRKLGDDGASARYIETVKGVGFRMAEGH